MKTKLTRYSVWSCELNEEDPDWADYQTSHGHEWVYCERDCMAAIEALEARIEELTKGRK